MNPQLAACTLNENNRNFTEQILIAKVLHPSQLAEVKLVFVFQLKLCANYQR